jgi:hypothetical protein
MSLPKICLICFTDGRPDVLSKTLESFKRNLVTDDGESFYFDHTILSDDSGQAGVQRSLYGRFAVIDKHKDRIGYTKSMIRTWDLIPKDIDFVFHLEDDWVLERPVMIKDMIWILDQNKNMAQVVLKRDPVNSNEFAVGDMLLQHPEDFTDKSYESINWCEHNRYFSCNPCLYPGWVVEVGWPDCEYSEGNFMFRLREKYPNVLCSYLGKQRDVPLITNIGFHRAGWGY